MIKHVWVVEEQSGQRRKWRPIDVSLSLTAAWLYSCALRDQAARDRSSCRFRVVKREVR